MTLNTDCKKRKQKSETTITILTGELVFIIGNCQRLLQVVLLLIVSLLTAFKFVIFLSDVLFLTFN